MSRAGFKGQPQLAPMEDSMESTNRATTTGSRPLGTALLRVSMMPMTPTISTPVPITCRDTAAAQHHGDWHHWRGLRELTVAPTWSKKPLAMET